MIGHQSESIWDLLKFTNEPKVRIAIPNGVLSGKTGDKLSGERRANGEFQENADSKLCLLGIRLGPENEDKSHLLAETGVKTKKANPLRVRCKNEWSGWRD